ncbi:GLPGLI family protein [Yeosuana marina]|uniref:GLPGLI family protein n=1 Tax=Yeosuana marina TaxID=1565536 RepID=UPI0030EC6F50|tara:strand:- start:944 stop:1801 length:858 start_codon:yes stop_codon:yes gene_type:complete
MNFIIKVIIISALTLFSTNVSAQNFKGEATYKTKRKVDIQLDSTQVNSEMHQKMLEMLKKQFEKTFILSFNKEESLYKEEEKLGAPQTGNVQMVFVSTDASDILYRNLKEKRYTSKNEVFGKIFLIKDSLPKLDWTLEQETKNIGEYTCFKATMKHMVPVVTGGISINDDKDLNANENEEPQMEEVTITAWYTPQIPINNGPAKYYGLPGLILEVNNGTETIVCSKLVLNPEDKVDIVEPRKGKVVNQEDFESIVEKRMQEENERMNNNRNDDDGERRIEIMIGP